MGEQIKKTEKPSIRKTIFEWFILVLGKTGLVFIEKIENEGKKDFRKEEYSSYRFILVYVALAFTLSLLIILVMPKYEVVSGSMEPTIKVGDVFCVTKFSYCFEEPQRGDIIVFKYPFDTKKHYIKRCIGLSGEKIEFRNNQLYVDDILTEQPYLTEGIVTEDYGPIYVPEGAYFMCGDNREFSVDSRNWGFVGEKLIIGKLQFRVVPVGEILEKISDKLYIIISKVEVVM